MATNQDAMLIVLAREPVEVRVASALQSAARALGYADGCSVLSLSDVGDLQCCVLTSDPWCVLAIDNAAVEALRMAFGVDAGQFAADKPAQVLGYTFVAVPDFSNCLDDQEAKRVAWRRMKAAAHPGNPLD